MYREKFSLEGKVAIVTGSGRGLGRAQALELAQAGADVVCTARTMSQVEETVAEVRKLGRRALAVQTDVTDSAQVNRLVEATLAEFGQIDILINNAGGGGGTAGRAFHEWTDEDWRSSVDINLSSVFYGARAVYPHMAQRHYGKIINISSGMGMRGNRGNPAYSATKAGVIHLTQALAGAWARDGLNVNCIAPGTFPTRVSVPQPGAVGEGRRTAEQRASFYPMRRLGRVEEIGYAAVFLASDASSYVNGATVLVDGASLAGGFGPVGYAFDQYLSE